MRNFSLLSKKSLLLAFLVLFVGGQNLFAMNPSDIIKSMTGTLENQLNNLSRDHDSFEKRYLGAMKTIVERFDIDIAKLELGYEKKIKKLEFKLTKEKKLNVDLNCIKNFPYFAFMWEHKKKTTAIALGLSVSSVLGYHLYLRRQRLRKEKADKILEAGDNRFHYIREPVCLMYGLIGRGVIDLHEFFIATNNFQKVAFKNALQKATIGAIMNVIKKEKWDWIKRNKKDFWFVHDNLKNIHGAFNISILNEKTIKKNCIIIDRLQGNMKKLFDEKVTNKKKKDQRLNLQEILSENFYEKSKKTLKEVILSDYKLVVDNIKSYNGKYNSKLWFKICNLKSVKGDLFGGTDTSQEFQICEYKVDPYEWYKDYVSIHRNLIKVLYSSTKKDQEEK